MVEILCVVVLKIGLGFLMLQRVYLCTLFMHIRYNNRKIMCGRNRKNLAEITKMRDLGVSVQFN
jgi:hypothetical protein